MGVRPRLKPRLRVWMRAGEVGGERVWVARAPPRGNAELGRRGRAARTPPCTWLEPCGLGLG